MGLNSRSKQMIEDGLVVLREAVVRRGAMSLCAAKDELRRSGTYKRVKTTTLDVIGVKGKRQKAFCYDPEHGFWPIGAPQPPGHMRDLVRDWAETTTDISKKMHRIHSAVKGVLSDFGDPTVDRDAARMVQEMTSRMPSENKDLGSFRSFVIWGIQNGKLSGDIRCLIPPAGLCRDGLQRGTARAYIALATLSTNTYGRWLWSVISPSGARNQMWATVPEMNVHIDNLLAEQEDDEEVNLDELLGEIDIHDAPMTLEEAIVDAEQLASSTTGRTAQNQKQIAEWLTELKEKRAQVKQLKKDIAWVKKVLS